MISVAAELAEMHPQTLRMYEARGLIEPKRSPKGTRLYSQDDVERLRRIQEMTAELGHEPRRRRARLRARGRSSSACAARSTRSSAARRGCRRRSPALEAVKRSGQGRDRALRGARGTALIPVDAPLPAGGLSRGGPPPRRWGDRIQGRRPGHVPVDAAGPQVGGRRREDRVARPRTRALPGPVRQPKPGVIARTISANPPLVAGGSASTPAGASCGRGVAVGSPTATGGCGRAVPRTISRHVGSLEPRTPWRRGRPAYRPSSHREPWRSPARRRPWSGTCRSSTAMTGAPRGRDRSSGDLLEAGGPRPVRGGRWRRRGSARYGGGAGASTRLRHAANVQSATDVGPQAASPTQRLEVDGRRPPPPRLDPPHESATWSSALLARLVARRPSIRRGPAGSGERDLERRSGTGSPEALGELDETPCDAASDVVAGVLRALAVGLAAAAPRGPLSDARRHRRLAGRTAGERRARDAERLDRLASPSRWPTRGPAVRPPMICSERARAGPLKPRIVRGRGASGR